MFSPCRYAPAYLVTALLGDKATFPGLFFLVRIHVPLIGHSHQPRAVVGNLEVDDFPVAHVVVGDIPFRLDIFADVNVPDFTDVGIAIKPQCHGYVKMAHYTLGHHLQGKQEREKQQKDFVHNMETWGCDMDRLCLSLGNGIHPQRYKIIFIPHINI